MAMALRLITVVINCVDSKSHNGCQNQIKISGPSRRILHIFCVLVQDINLPPLLPRRYQ